MKFWFKGSDHKRTGNPQTATSHVGGFIELAVVDLGNQTGALATVQVTRRKSTVASSSTSEQLLPADVSQAGKCSKVSRKPWRRNQGKRVEA